MIKSQKMSYYDSGMKTIQNQKNFFVCSQNLCLSTSEHECSCLSEHLCLCSSEKLKTVVNIMAIVFYFDLFFTSA